MGNFPHIYRQFDSDMPVKEFFYID